MRLIFGGNSDIAKAIMGKKVTRQMCDVNESGYISDYILSKKPNEIVNCAGYISSAPIKFSNIYEWEQEIKTNLIASYYIAKAGALINAKMVFIGSTSGLRGRANWSGYCASKAGLISLVQSLAEEGYDAWCVNPSRTDTKMRNKLFPNEDKNTLLKPSDIAQVVERCFQHEFSSGSNIKVVKNGLEINL